MRSDSSEAASTLRAIRPGGCGDRVAWNRARSLPCGNSPLYFAFEKGIINVMNATVANPQRSWPKTNSTNKSWPRPR